MSHPDAIWYYVDAQGQQQGPVTSPIIAGQFRLGRLTATSLVWREGLATWVALDDVRGELGIAKVSPIAATPPVAPVTPPTAPSALDPRSADQSTPAPMQGAVGDIDRQDIVYAGFLRRWAALFIDSIILSVVFYALSMVFGMAAVFGSAGLDVMSPDTGSAALNSMLGMLYLFYFLMAGTYYSLLESSSNQATVGKMALGIKVTDRHGQRLSFAHALGRWAAASISYLTFYIGFFLAGWTERKQALHDFVAGTLVVDRWAFTDQPEKQQRQLHGCAVAFLVVIALLIVISVIGIVAAIAIPAYEGYVQRM
jgi:uncharacterized RDD family membrane protein YckC